MAPNGQQIKRGLAKGLGINLNYRNETGNAAIDDKLTRGESVFSVDSADTYTEDEPSVREYLEDLIPSGHDVVQYISSLFPFTHWILHYNLQWLIGDLVAGITIGAIVVPQGMAYAQLAQLPVQYGLYTSFMGVLIYWFFATSKDITIGPVAVMSTIVGNIITGAQGTGVSAVAIAETLAIICGGIVFGIGILRLGRIVEFISLPAVSAFITGSAINIAVGQVPTLLNNASTVTATGTINWFNPRDATYLVIINTLKYLPKTKLDAAIGLTSLFMLYLIRFVFNTLAKRQPQRKKTWFFCNTLRSVFVILLYTLIGWLANLHLVNHNEKNSPFKILGTVPRGFTAAGVPQINSNVINAIAPQIPVSVIVLLIEHISIAKQFGRINNYTINPSQELVAIGVTNLLAPFLGGYPATGSFSRTAIKSKAGVRTPLAGVITAIVVLLAIYALPAVFFYIPNAALAAVIIHAVGDLITPPNTVYQFWRISPIEVVVFFAGVLVTIFVTIEVGIYVTISFSFAIQIWRMLFARGRFLGRLQVHSVVGDHVLQDKQDKSGKDSVKDATREIFVPLEHADGSNSNFHVKHPYPGIFIYRFSEGYNYPSASSYLDQFVHEIFTATRRTNLDAYPRLGDRPWNDPGPRRGKLPVGEDTRPTLKAVIMDFSSVNITDLTSVQSLIDVRNQLDRYATPHSVQWHFANVTNRWTKRALVAGGFGYPTPDSVDGFQRWKPVFSVAEIGGENSAAAAAQDEVNRQERKRRQSTKDLESGVREREVNSNGDSSSSNSLDREITQSQAYGPKDPQSKVAVVHGINRPLFHLDLTSALQSAISNVERFHGAEDVELVAQHEEWKPEKLA